MENSITAICGKLLVVGIFTSSAHATDYFVDATGGNDSQDGLTQNAAWQTVSKINTQDFNPGDNINFRRGEVWREQLLIDDVGTAAQPITISSYGDTQLARPLLVASDLYSEWIEVSELYNAGFEQLYDPANDDPFLIWQEQFDKTIGSLIERDSTTSSQGSYSAHLFYAGETGGTFLRTSNILVDDDTEYRLAFSSMSAPGSTLRVRVRLKLETGEFRYLDTANQWQAQFSSSYDRPFTDPVWTSQSEIVFQTLPDSSSINIYFFNKDGTGSVWVDDTYFDKTTTGQGRIWQGYVEGIEQTTGAMLNGVRLSALPHLPRLDDQANTQLQTMLDGEFHGPKPTSLTPFFYYRNDLPGPGGKPTALEVGVRDHAILVDGASYIHINDIDTQGPTNRQYTSGYRRYVVLVTGSSDNIVIDGIDNSHSYGRGIGLEGGTSNSTLNNINSFDHGTTCVYFWGAGIGNGIFDSDVHDCGNLVTDIGDKGLIGIFNTDDVVVSGCTVSNNGFDGSNLIDAAISVVQGSDVQVFGNTIINAGAVGIQFAEGSDNCIASYNVVNGWATKGGTYGEGIRIGGGSDGTDNCTIQNNLLINGQANPNTDNGNNFGEWGAIAFRRNQTHANTIVRNNIFYNNAGIYELKVEAGANLAGSVFSNNIYYRTAGDAINWKGNNYAFDRIIGATIGYYSFDQLQEQGSQATVPLLANAPAGDFHLAAGSPAIDSGQVTGLFVDIEGNPVLGLPDIGAFEFGNNDTDNDGLTDYDEACYDGNCQDYNPYNPVTNPTGSDLDINNNDTDGDGYRDGTEAGLSSDPLNAASVPAITADGDVSLDGQVNVADILLAQRAVLGLISLTAEQIAHGDYRPAPSGDGVLTTADLLLIYKEVITAL